MAPLPHNRVHGSSLHTEDVFLQQAWQPPDPPAIPSELSTSAAGAGSFPVPISEVPNQDSDTSPELDICQPDHSQSVEAIHDTSEDHPPMSKPAVHQDALVVHTTNPNTSRIMFWIFRIILWSQYLPRYCHGAELSVTRYSHLFSSCITPGIVLNGWTHKWKDEERKEVVMLECVWDPWVTVQWLNQELAWLCLVWHGCFLCE